jgi:hypothetical protein
MTSSLPPTSSSLPLTSWLRAPRLRFAGAYLSHLRVQGEPPAEGGESFSVAAELREHSAFVIPGLPEPWIQRASAVKRVDCFLVPVERKQQSSLVMLGLGGVGGRLQLLFEGGEGPCELPLGGEGHGLGGEDAQCARLQGRRLVVGDDSVIVAGDPGERATLAGPRMDILWSERQGPVVCGKGFAVTVERGESDTEETPGYWRLRIALNRRLETGKCFRMATLDKEFLAMVEISRGGIHGSCSRCKPILIHERLTASRRARIALPGCRSLRIGKRRCFA